MISPEVKEAWRAYKNFPSLASPILDRFADAYVEAEWQRRKAEHQKDCDDYVYPKCKERCWASTRTDAQWREDVLKELRES